MLVGLLTLAGCVGALQPMGPPVTVPRLDRDAAVAEDGYRLPLRVWRPEGRERAVLVAVHGFNDYSLGFEDAGRFLAGRGVVTYAYDQRGFGATQRPGIWAGAETLRADLRTVAALIARRHPGVPLFLLGESMGGAVVMTTLCGPLAEDSPLRRLRGAILVAPAVWGREVMNPLHRAALWVAVTLVPGLEVSPPRELGILPSDNLEMLRARGRDPLVPRANRVDTVDGLVGLMGEALAVAPHYRVPGLVLYGVHEQILPREPVERLLETLPAGRQRLAVYVAGWHMLLRDLNARIVLNDIAAWIEHPGAPLPSRADEAPRAPFAGLGPGKRL